MHTESIHSSWAQQQTQAAQGKTSQNFAASLATSGLAPSQGNGVRSGGQLLSDDLTRALASYRPASPNAPEG